MSRQRFRGLPAVYRTDDLGSEYSVGWPRPLVPGYRVAIYGLRSAAGGPFYYVGSSYRPKVRLRAHWIERTRDRDEKSRWLGHLAACGERPVLVVLEWTTERRRQEREQRWITFLRANGHPLTNRTE